MPQPSMDLGIPKRKKLSVNPATLTITNSLISLRNLIRILILPISLFSTK